MKTASTWLEVSMTVEAELAEAVAEVMARYAPQGVVIESTALAAYNEDLQANTIGPLRVMVYLRTDDQLEDIRNRLEESLWYLGRIQPLPEPDYRLVKETDWAEAWKTHYHPISVGRRLKIIPAWLEPEDSERIAIRMDPGMAFGTGTHPTTQLCLALIEEMIDFGSLDQDVIDIGCGSGILAIAALKLGARRALGVDVDPLAVSAARDNAILNVVADRMLAEEGSFEDVLNGKYPLNKARLVLANIIAPVLERMLDGGLADLLTPGGVLVMSGIIDSQADQITRAVERNGLEVTDQRQIDDWLAFVVT